MAPRRRNDIWLPRKRRRRWPWVAALVAVIAVAAGWGLSAWSDSASSHGAATQTHTTTPTPSTTTPSTTTPSTTSTTPTAPPGKPVPILMYHVIESPPAGTALPELFLPAARFNAQMAYLKSHGFHPVTLAQVWKYWTAGGTLPVHPIVLSFDDGYRSQFTTAARTLHRYGWPGVLNMIVKHLHEGTYGLGERDIQTMIAWGWELDSHTLTHPDLTTVHGAALTAEVGGSRTQLQNEFHVPVSFFCYPAGAYDDEVIAAVKAAGYLAATTTHEGVADPSQGAYELDRIRVDGNMTVDGLAAQLGSLGVAAG